MDQSRNEFLIEIEELIEKSFLDLDELRLTEFAPNRQRQAIDQIFRHTHSVKGLAAAAGLEALGVIAHEFENMLEALRAGRISLTAAVLTTSEKAIEALAESLSLSASGFVEPSRRFLFNELQTLARGNVRHGDAAAEAILENIPSTVWQTLSESEQQRLVMVAREGSPIFVVEASFSIASFDEEFFQLREKLTEGGEVIATSPAVDALQPERVKFSILYASHESLGDLQRRVAGFTPAKIIPIAQTTGGSPFAKEKECAMAVPSADRILPSANFVRTDLSQLDKLISAAHELFRLTSSALEFANNKKRKTQNGAQLEAATETIRRSFLRLEEELIGLRMLTVGPTLQRALRLGRAAARQSGKEIDFEIAGKDLRLDKVVAEALAEPLVHLLRNAVDHGIESPEERARSGKPARGKIRLEAFSEGSQTRLRVMDDGRGIDPALVAAAAQRLGIVTEPELDLERSLRLIFRPGFSTLASASEISGRGVGLDVVETAVEQAGGELRVSSKPGEGTTFEIRLPVTCGLLTAGVVAAHGNRYCIPASQIVNISPLINKRKTLRVKKSDAAPAQLSKLLGLDSPGKKSLKAQRLITCQLALSDDQQNGDKPSQIEILVDAFETTQEVLVRSLGRFGGRWYGITGAAELRDGSVALVLDVSRLLQSANQSSSHVLWR